MTGSESEAPAREGRAAPASARPQANSGSPAISYIPSLDGIRAISFFLVFLAHAGLGSTVIPGGFGVSVFFLLSGFLITTLLRAEYSHYGHISLGQFYFRRVLRIQPPLYAAMALAMLLSSIGPQHPGIPFAATLAQALQVFNYYAIYATSVVSMPGSDVLWSLAVEEHFYLLFPLLYVWMRPRLSGHLQAVVLLTLCAAALAWRCILHFYLHASFTHTYYGTDARFDSILFGCVFAIASNPTCDDPIYRWLIRRMKWLLPLCGVVLLGTFLYRDDGFRQTLRYTLQGLALVPLFIAAIHYRHSWPVVFLNLRVVRFLGTLSYVLYLCHFIILEYFQRVWGGNPVLTGAVALACALCFASLVHYGIERPCSRLRRRLSPAPAH